MPPSVVLVRDDPAQRDEAPTFLRALAAAPADFLLPPRAVVFERPAGFGDGVGMGVTLGYSSMLNSLFNKASKVDFRTGT